MKQVAVRSVDLEKIEARGHRAAHGIAVSGEHRLEVALAERARRDPARVDRLVGGRDDAPRLVAAVEIGLRERGIAVPRTRDAGLAPGVRELQRRYRALGPHEIRNSF